MKVKFVPQNVEYEIKPGETVMGLAHEKGIPIRSTCNGLPSCAECRVRVTDGDWNTNPPSRKELSLIGTGYYIDQRRLSCQLLCFGDITVDTTEQIEKEGEGPVTKKFLTKVHKSSVDESHSVGGVFIEQDGQLLQELKKDVREPSGSGEMSTALSEPQRRERHHGGGRDGGRGRDRGQGGGRGRDGGQRGGGGRDGRGHQGGRDGGQRGEGGGRDQMHAGGQGDPSQSPREGGNQGGRRGGRGRRRRR